MKRHGLVTPDLAELIEVIHTEATRGEGTEENPVRIVHQYWSKDGVLLAENDAWSNAEEDEHVRTYN